MIWLIFIGIVWLICLPSLLRSNPKIKSEEDQTKKVPKERALEIRWFNEDLCDCETLSEHHIILVGIVCGSTPVVFYFCSNCRREYKRINAAMLSPEQARVLVDHGIFTVEQANRYLNYSGLQLLIDQVKTVPGAFSDGETYRPPEGSR